MEFGDWIGAILILGSIFFSAFFENKKSKGKKTEKERDFQRDFEKNDEYSSFSSYSNAFRTIFVEEDSDEPEEEYVIEPKPDVRPAIPPAVPSAFEEGQRITADAPRSCAVATEQRPVAFEPCAATAASEPLGVVPEPQPRSKKPFALHDKDALRRAIILADILPPKF